MNPPGTGIYQAEILQTFRDSHAQRLRRLSEQAGYQVLDTLHAQVRDLVQTREPARKMDAREVDAAVVIFLASQGADYGAWAHYPWSRRLVRVLPEADFIELRTNRNQQKITAREQTCLAAKKVGIVGLSVGQSVALTLALERSCGEIRLADFDVIDLSNLNRLRCGIHNIGLPKTVVAAREIAELDPYLRVVCFNDGYTETDADAFLDGLDVLVDECDSLDVKLRMRTAARSRGIPVLMNTSDRGMTDVERFDNEPERPLFHGRLKDLGPEVLEGLSTEEKIPIVLDIIGLSTSSVRLRASMLEIEQSIKTWPQLASDVTLGGAVVCDVARRVLLGEAVASGRYYVDLADVGARGACIAPEPPAAPPPGDGLALPATAHPFDAIAADAALAPSAGNAQPWRWQAANGELRLVHRRQPQSSVLYHDDKAAMVGLGATLESALISAHHHGYLADIVVDARGETVATMALTARCSAGDTHAGDAPLYPQLARRRSVRVRPSVPADIPRSALEAMAAQVGRFPGLTVSWLTARHEIEALAQLVGEAERLRVLDPESHADMMREIAWSDSDHRQTGEGIPLAALSLRKVEEAGLQMLRDAEVVATLCEWNLGAGLMKLAHELVASSSVMGLLWSSGETHLDYLSGGRAMQRVWLEATRTDLGLCPVTAICYLLSAWRSGRTMTALQEEALPAIETRFRALFHLPAARGDVVLFRLIPAAEILDMPRSTHRRPSRA